MFHSRFAMFVKILLSISYTLSRAAPTFFCPAQYPSWTGRVKCELQARSHCLHYNILRRSPKITVNSEYVKSSKR